MGYEVYSTLGIYYDIAWKAKEERIKEERIKNKFNEIKEKESRKKILYPVTGLYTERPGDLAQDEKGNLFIREKEGVYTLLTRREWI